VYSRYDWADRMAFSSERVNWGSGCVVVVVAGTVLLVEVGARIVVGVGASVVVGTGASVVAGALVLVGISAVEVSA
jgi:hypothetical protein